MENHFTLFTMAVVDSVKEAGREAKEAVGLTSGREFPS